MIFVFFLSFLIYRQYLIFLNIVNLSLKEKVTMKLYLLIFLLIQRESREIFPKWEGEQGWEEAEGGKRDETKN